jgi:hypothetical protein
MVEPIVISPSFFVIYAFRTKILNMLKALRTVYFCVTIMIYVYLTLSLLYLFFIFGSFGVKSQFSSLNKIAASFENKTSELWQNIYNHANNMMSVYVCKFVRCFVDYFYTIILLSSPIALLQPVVLQRPFVMNWHWQLGLIA